MFAGVQQSHVMACDAYEEMPVRTGYEQVIAHNVNDIFAVTAKQNGVVTNITDTGKYSLNVISVKYDDGSTESFEIGRRFTAAAGLTLPHDLITDLKIGEKFKSGDAISYNKAFFKHDTFSPSNIMMKNSILVRTAIMQTTELVDDSSIISKKTAERLSSRLSKVKDILVLSNQHIHKLVSVGDEVNTETILCIIENSLTSNLDIFNENSLDTLKAISAQTPIAKVNGVIDRIEVYYRGDVEDMSPSLQKLVKTFDGILKNHLNHLGKPIVTGSVDDGFRINGSPIPIDSVNIRIYITSDMSVVGGDKGVFANQMKTVFCGVYETPIYTESGLEIDAKFSYLSIQARKVDSPIVMGTTAVLLNLAEDKACKAYFEE